MKKTQYREAIVKYQKKKFSVALTPPVNRSILQEADRIVNGERRSDYGPNESFGKMARVYNELWGGDLVAKDFVRMLMVVKLVRESFKHKRDNLTDLTGYTELLNRLEDEAPEEMVFERIIK